MPELPEVEIVVRGLRETVLGETIAKVHVAAPPSSTFVSPSFDSAGFAGVLEGRKILDINRRGKNILISLSGDVTLWVHLKMTGHFFYVNRTDPVDKHDLVIFDLQSALKRKRGAHLRFHDSRRFGRLRLFPDDELRQQPQLAELGPEPLDMSPEELIAMCKKSHRMIKPALLDQSFLAGLGNIYADESLYATRLHPRRITSSVSHKKLRQLHKSIRSVLNRAIRLMGTSVVSYRGVDGEIGRFQNSLKVYGREGEPCGRCGSRIVRQKIGSRSAHFCPRCQRPR
jgi:formamidopyrimidine-DNA glycosylase